MQAFDLESIPAGADCAVLRVAGEVDAYTAPQLRERVIGLLADGEVNIVVDLRKVDFLDSTGLGALVGSLKRTRMQDGSLKLIMGSGRILQIFRGGDRRRPALAGGTGARRTRPWRLVPRTRPVTAEAVGAQQTPEA
jgi:anti-anti-sigma factor